MILLKIILGRSFMKGLYLWLVGCLLLLAGCSSSKPVNEALQEQNYKMLFTFQGENNYYDMHGACFLGDGSEKTCRRILENNYGYVTFLLINETGKFQFDINNGVVKKLTYVDILDKKDAKYQYIYDIDQDTKVIQDKREDSKNWCTYRIQGEDEGQQLADCKEDTKETYEALKRSFDATYSTLDVSEKQLITYVEAFQKEHLNEMKQVVEDKLAEQKALTAKEIETNLTKGYTIDEHTKNSFKLVSTDKKAELSGINVNGKVQYFTYTYKTISGNESKFQISYMYYPNLDMELISNTDASCMYDLGKGENVGSDLCNKEQILEGTNLKNGITSALRSIDLTKHDVILYFQEMLP